MEILTCTYNEVIASGVMPRRWKLLRTVMLPKKKKPVAREHRPKLFIVRYCIEEMYRKGRELVVVAIDFEKAFGSVRMVASFG